MKRIVGIAAMMSMLAAARAAFAGVNVFLDFGQRAPVYVAPVPVYAVPSRSTVWYAPREPRWVERREFIRRHELREYQRTHNDRYWR